MDSSLNSLCIFYNQAVFYRRNQIEKQFILDKINNEIVETEKACKKLAESIVDLNNQPKASIAKLNQHRRNLADLYVKQLLLNQKVKF
uniref:Uncharacterized protein n=1 Tax=Panagrolaimus sp. PS1159 TaxID=55785 RepID=A0AC35GUN4_9BILA